MKRLATHSVTKDWKALAGNTPTARRFKLYWDEGSQLWCEVLTAGENVSNFNYISDPFAFLPRSFLWLTAVTLSLSLSLRLCTAHISLSLLCCRFWSILRVPTTGAGCIVAVSRGNRGWRREPGCLRSRLNCSGESSPQQRRVSAVCYPRCTLLSPDTLLLLIWDTWPLMSDGGLKNNFSVCTGRRESFYSIPLHAEQLQHYNIELEFFSFFVCFTHSLPFLTLPSFSNPRHRLYPQCSSRVKSAILDVQNH